MSINGDLVAAFQARFKVDDLKAREIILMVLEEAKDPNFAQKYAEEQLEGHDHPSTSTRAVGGNRDQALNDKMLDYWDVLDFIKRTV